jgi:hypothetical protein
MLHKLHTVVNSIILSLLSYGTAVHTYEWIVSGVNIPSPAHKFATATAPTGELRQKQSVISVIVSA